MGSDESNKDEMMMKRPPPPIPDRLTTKPNNNSVKQVPMSFKTSPNSVTQLQTTSTSTSTSSFAQTSNSQSQAYQPRTWLDSKGKHSLKATYVPSNSAASRNRVRLLKEDSGGKRRENECEVRGEESEGKKGKGKLIEVELERLCLEDRNWVGRERHFERERKA